MASDAATILTPARFREALSARRLRSVTGLILFAYVLTHLLNHALGLISVRAQETALRWFVALWDNPVGTVVLYGSLLSHMSLAFVRLYRRRSLRMPPWELAQLLLGLAVPPLLVDHVLATRLAFELFDVRNNYFYVEYVLWTLAPGLGFMQMTVLIVAWLHGCIGLHFWLRIRPWYPRAVPYFYGAALLVPMLALLGFAEGGREIAAYFQAHPDRLQPALKGLNFPGPEAGAVIGRAVDGFLYAFAAAILGVLVARRVRTILERRRGLVRVTYPAGRVVEYPPGFTILEISRSAGIPHASVCGGRGRCSTCRVRVNTGLEHQPPASPEELRVLHRVGAPPSVRLACQLRPVGELDITPLLPPTATARDAVGRPRHLEGEERVIAILFADLRAFTKFAERKLPYDVVFVLNRYFSAMGHAIENAGGRVDKFIGDGVMALFGIDEGPERGCRQAIAAARAMAAQLAELNRTLAHELAEPLRIGIGIHVGPAIVGEMGYARATSLTAIGDAVNTASRLETVTKDYQAQLVLSDQVAHYAGLDTAPYAHHEIMIRGRGEPLVILVIPDAGVLPERIGQTAPSRGRGEIPQAAG
jgi:adenylate cyclase